MTVEEDCPIRNSTPDAKEQFAPAMVAEHIKENAKRAKDPKVWINEHTENGALSEIREAL